MSNEKFKRDLAQGHVYETKALKYFDYDTVDVKTGYFKDYDFEFTKDGKTKRVEVKSDGMASKTGNLCIEYSYKGKPSGVKATTADYWVHFVVYDDTDEAYIIPVADLKTLVRGCRAVKSGDNYNAMSYLLPKYKVEKYIKWLDSDKNKTIRPHRQREQYRGKTDEDMLCDLIGSLLLQ